MRTHTSMHDAQTKIPKETHIYTENIQETKP